MVRISDPFSHHGISILLKQVAQHHGAIERVVFAVIKYFGVKGKEKERCGKKNEVHPSSENFPCEGKSARFTAFHAFDFGKSGILKRNKLLDKNLIWL